MNFPLLCDVTHNGDVTMKGTVHCQFEFDIYLISSLFVSQSLLMNGHPVSHSIVFTSLSLCFRSFPVKVVHLRSLGLEFELLSAVGLTPSGVDSACHPS